ncbi:MAG: dihydropteroate synthase [Aromatoleum sp.]|nr:dihydropteroate synthase [Aromatoleum sp.]
MTAPIFRCGRFTFDLSRTIVMGVVNVTPDSFSDGGSHFDAARAIAHARQCVADGAAIVDIGGESTRPGAAEVPDADELARILPVVESLTAAGIPVSVDTRKPAVMRAAIAAGAAMINDVAALTAPGAIEVCASAGVGICLMHMRGEPRTMQQTPVYDDVVGEVRAFLVDRARACEAAGIERNRLAIDPGFGFGKTPAHNLSLLRKLETLVATGYPVLVGLSRKSTLGLITGRPVGERLAASVAAALVAVAGGAAIVRVHDVRETVDALKVWQAVKGDLDRR